jgi:plastocyanin
MRSISGVCVLACALTAACGGGGGYSGSSATTAPSSATTSGALTITITSQNGAQSFSPNPASAGGMMVVFKNNDSIAHRVVLNDGTVDTGNIAPGTTSAAVQMPASGTNYHCALHTTMVGAVSGASGQPPNCEGPYCDGTGYY